MDGTNILRNGAVFVLLYGKKEIYSTETIYYRSVSLLYRVSVAFVLDQWNLVYRDSTAFLPVYTSKYNVCKHNFPIIDWNKG